MSVTTLSNRWKRDAGGSPIVGNSRSGAALIVTLWVLLLLSMMIASFAYEMRVESEVTAYSRNKFKALFLAQAGVEWAKTALTKKVTQGTEGDLIIDKEDDMDLVIAANNLARGVPATGVEKELGAGTFTVDIMPEEGRRNVNMLSDQDWEEILDQSGVPEDLWPELIDCFADWIDPGDEHHLNGAESDDSFYKEKGYECKNAPLDTVDELLLIKGFTEEIVFGGVSEDPDEEPMTGIAQWLTTYGDGRVNVNTASREVLLTFIGMDDQMVDEILERRLGVDGQLNTKDDGLKSLGEIPGMRPELEGRLSVDGRQYIRVASVGDVNGVKAGVWCILQVGGNEVIPLFWREEMMQ